MRSCKVIVAGGNGGDVDFSHDDDTIPESSTSSLSDDEAEEMSGDTYSGSLSDTVLDDEAKETSAEESEEGSEEADGDSDDSGQEDSWDDDEGDIEQGLATRRLMRENTEDMEWLPNPSDQSSTDDVTDDVATSSESELEDNEG